MMIWQKVYSSYDSRLCICDSIRLACVAIWKNHSVFSISDGNCTAHGKSGYCHPTPNDALVMHEAADKFRNR